MNPGRLFARILVWSVVGVWMSWLSPVRALAQEEPEALIRQGVELRRQGDNARAHGYFARAYDIAHTPRSAAQLGLVELALSDFRDAEQHLSEALGSHDPWVNENRALLEGSRETARAHIGKVVTHGSGAGTTVQIDGRPAILLGADGIVWLSPGPAALTFVAPNRQAVVMQVTIVAGESLSVDIDPPATKAPETPDPPPPASAPPSEGSAPAVTVAATRSPPPQEPLVAGRLRVRRVAGLVLAGAGAAVGVAGALVYASGASKLDAIKRDAGAGAPYNPDNANYRTLGNAGVGLMVTAGLTVAAGAAVYLLSVEPSVPAVGATTIVSAGYLPGTGGGFMIARRF